MDYTNGSSGQDWELSANSKNEREHERILKEIETTDTAFVGASLRYIVQLFLVLIIPRSRSMSFPERFMKGITMKVFYHALINESSNMIGILSVCVTSTTMDLLSLLRNLYKCEEMQKFSRLVVYKSINIV